MLTTRFTELVGCTMPIQQAGMGDLAQPRLAAAVSNAGGLGMVSIGGLPPAMIEQLLEEARQHTAGPIGANILLPFEQDDLPAIIDVAAAHANVVDFFWGDPARSVVDRVHAGGALACWQVGSVEEAVAAEDAGCDFIIAQGIEAGGHVRARIGILAQLSQVLSQVRIPVLAAGGIGTGRALAAVLAAGADGARVGTRLVSAVEAEAHPVYVDALIHARPEDSVYTTAFSVGWPDAPHRVLRQSVEAAAAFPDDVVGERFRPSKGEWMPQRRFQVGAPHRDRYRGAVEAMAHWAGESVVGVKSLQPAAEIIQEMVGEAEELLRRW
jgi:nitronate monooxygenase